MIVMNENAAPPHLAAKITHLFPYEWQDIKARRVVGFRDPKNEKRKVKSEKKICG